MKFIKAGPPVATKPGVVGAKPTSTMGPNTSAQSADPRYAPPTSDGRYAAPGGAMTQPNESQRHLLDDIDVGNSIVNIISITEKKNWINNYNALLLFRLFLIGIIVKLASCFTPR